MKYTPNLKKKDFARACGINKAQETRLLNAVTKAFENLSRDFNIDEINAFVAPYIKTPEEAFFIGQSIVATVYGAAAEMGVKPYNQDLN